MQSTSRPILVVSLKYKELLFFFVHVSRVWIKLSDADSETCLWVTASIREIREQETQDEYS